MKERLRATGGQERNRHVCICKHQQCVVISRIEKRESGLRAIPRISSLFLSFLSSLLRHKNSRDSRLESTLNSKQISEREKLFSRLVLGSSRLFHILSVGSCFPRTIVCTMTQRTADGQLRVCGEIFKTLFRYSRIQ